MGRTNCHIGGRVASPRLRAGALATALLTAAVLVGCSSDPDDGGAAPAEGGVEATYMSLGDSYAQGYQPADADEETADYTQGFAYLLPEKAEALGYDLELINFGCGGATVGSMVESDGCVEPARAPGGPVYDVPQLQAAIQYLEENPGEIEVITVSIGGNDVTACALGDPAGDPITCVAGAVGRIEEGLTAALADLREAAGPDTVIIGLTYPDVILGAYLDEDGRTLAALSVTAFQQFINPTLKKAYESVDGIFVDVTAGTGAYTPLTETTTLDPYGEVPEAVAEVCELTWFCEASDIHPRDEGYEVIADLIVESLPER